MQLESCSAPNGAFLSPPRQQLEDAGLDTAGPPGTRCPPRCGLARSSAAIEPLGKPKTISLPAAPTFLPVSELGKNFRGGWLRAESGKGSLSRTSFRFPQRSLTLLAQQHHHYKTCGNKSHYSPTICFNPLMGKMVSP